MLAVCQPRARWIKSPVPARIRRAPAGHLAAAGVLGVTGYLCTSTSGTITRMGDFLRGDRGASQPGQAG
jgi:hypothetical protein